MSTAADHDPSHDDWDEDDSYEDDSDWYEVGEDGCCAHVWDESCPARGCHGEHLDDPAPGVHPADVRLLGGAAPDALFGLERIRDVPAALVPPAVMVQAVLGAQRLASYAKAQAMYWTAALARPDVAVPVADVLDSLAHRDQEPGPAGDVPGEWVDRAAAGTAVAGDQLWDAWVAAEAASAAEPELSAAWLVAPITARRRIADAQELVDELPATFRALEQGRIEEIRARIIAETTAVLDPGLRRRAEALIVDRATRGMCPGDLRRLATKVVADLDPDAAAKRAEQARARRGTTIRNLGDDLGRFTADLAVEDAALTQAVLDLLAAAIPPQARQGRGISQLRADIFADLFGELADTGLIDLRGINPHNTDPTHTDPDDNTDSTNNTDPTDLTADPDPARVDAEQDHAADATDVDAAHAEADQDPGEDTAQPGPSEPDKAETGPAEPGNAEPDATDAGVDPATPAPAEPDGDTDTDGSGVAEPDEADADEADAAGADADGADADGADADGADAGLQQEADTDTDTGTVPAPSEMTGRGEAAADPGQPAAHTDAAHTDAGDPRQSPRDDSTEPEPERGDPNSGPTERDPGTSSPADLTGAVDGDADPPDPDAGRTNPDPDPDGDRCAPTFAELLTRLRSVDWESHLDADPDCPRRGGLLSMVRLPAGVRVNLDVTVALSTLAGCDDLSARLAGLGVITADTARALATAAGTVRILVLNDPPSPPGPPNGSPPPGSDGGGERRLAVDPNDPDRPTTQHHGGIHHDDSPDCGTVLDFGRTTYRPPASVIDRVDTRDQRCRFPGCPQIAERCDHDHRITWDDGGATCPCDLDALCRFHHRAKTFTAWTAIRDQKANTLTWTSPLGRIHIDRPTPDLPTGTPMNLGDRPKLSDPPTAERVADGVPAAGAGAGAGCPWDDETAESEIGSADSDLPPF